MGHAGRSSTSPTRCSTSTAATSRPAATSSRPTPGALPERARSATGRGSGRRRGRCTGWTSRAAASGSRAPAIAEAGREGEAGGRVLAQRRRRRRRGRRRRCRLLARAFADEPPDLILRRDAVARPPVAVRRDRAPARHRLPVWLSFRRCRHGLCGVYGQHWGGPEGDAFGRAARRFEEMGVGGAAGQLHPARPRRRDDLLPARLHRPAARRLPQPRLLHERRLAVRAGHRRRASTREMALRWREEGAQIIGGCCGVRPEHIAAAREAPATAPRPGRRRAAGADGPHASRPDRARRASRVASTAAARTVYPLPFPELVAPPGVFAPIPGTLPDLALPLRGGHRRAPALPGRRQRAPACRRCSSRSTARRTCTPSTSTSAPWPTRSTTLSATASPTA